MAAIRPVYEIVTDPDNPHYFKKVDVEFKWYPGLSVIQRRRSIVSMQQAYLEDHPDQKVIEVTTKALNKIGEQFSPFYLTVKVGDRELPVESVYHACKIYENAGPFTDILEKEPGHARKDPRGKNSGALIGFRFDGLEFPPEPRTFFFCWLYITALREHPEQAKELLNYTAFTDILFNPKKGLVNQALACAIYVSLVKRDMIDEAMKSPGNFYRTVFEGRPSL